MRRQLHLCRSGCFLVDVHLLVLVRSDPKALAQSEEEARFDRMRRELVFEAKGAAGERTRTAEELAQLERLRLQVCISVPLLFSQNMKGGSRSVLTDAGGRPSPSGGCLGLIWGHSME